MTSDFVLDKQNLGFLLADERGNLTMYAHDPHALESRGGLNLLARGDFYVGALVNSTLRIPMALSSSDLMRHAIWFGECIDCFAIGSSLTNTCTFSYT